MLPPSIGTCDHGHVNIPLVPFLCQLRSSYPTLCRELELSVCAANVALPSPSYIHIHSYTCHIPVPQNMYSVFIHIHRFVVGATVVHFFNITAIYIGTRTTREKKTPQPMIEEKSNGAIMLY